MKLELEELADQAENLVSLSDILTEALSANGSAAIRYVGAARLLEEHICKLHTDIKALFDKAYGESEEATT